MARVDRALTTPCSLARAFDRLVLFIWIFMFVLGD
jgi:hypothetical protein